MYSHEPWTVIEVRRGTRGFCQFLMPFRLRMMRPFGGVDLLWVGRVDQRSVRAMRDQQSLESSEQRDLLFLVSWRLLLDYKTAPTFRPRCRNVLLRRWTPTSQKTASTSHQVMQG